MKIKISLMAAAVVSAALTNAYADTMVWTNTAGGSFQAAPNWKPNAVPGGLDTVEFRSNGTYTVTLDDNVNVTNVTLPSGQFGLTLDLNGYSLTSASNGYVALGSSAGSAIDLTIASSAPRGAFNLYRMDFYKSIENAGGTVTIAGPNTSVNVSQSPTLNSSMLTVTTNSAFIISDGAHVTFRQPLLFGIGTVGFGTGIATASPKAVLLVTDPGTTFTNTATTIAGKQGTNMPTIVVSNQATFVCNSALSVGSGGDTWYSYSPKANGKFVVTGTKSYCEAASVGLSALAGEFGTVGSTAGGYVVVEKGGLLNVKGTLTLSGGYNQYYPATGVNPGAITNLNAYGEVIVRNPGSVLKVAGNVQLTAVAQGALHVLDGATLTSGAASVLTLSVGISGAVKTNSCVVTNINAYGLFVVSNANSSANFNNVQFGPHGSYGDVIVADNARLSVTNGTGGYITLSNRSRLIVSDAFVETPTLTTASNATVRIELGARDHASAYITTTTLATLNAQAKLEIGVLGSAMLKPGDTVTLLTYAGSCNGFFKGLPEGAFFSANGYHFRIYYGDGSNDAITLTCLHQPLGTVIWLRGALPEPPPAPTYETDTLRLAIGADAHIIEFTDKASGTNYYAAAPGAVFASVKLGGQLFAATKATLTAAEVVIDFGGTDVRLTLKITGAGTYLVVEVLAVTGTAVEELLFVTMPLTLKGVKEEPFAACALALNLQTKVAALPQATSRLDARCYPRFGFVGAKVALIGCPQTELRRVLQEVVTAAPELPHSPLGGPWALDADITRGSYLFAAISEQNADDWIALAQSLGINQIDFDGMSRRGDTEPVPSLYPNGLAGLKTVVDKVHAAGLKAGLHTYSFFIDKRCPWVTPVPDPRLGKAATFTLAGALTAISQTISVVEPTTNMSAVTGFFVRNSATLQVDNELIVYSDVSKTAPYVFTRCQRGACSTLAAPHAQGAKVYHLKECFGFFTPDPDSTLLAEVATRQAQTVNTCGFDMMYMDALDGQDILGGAANSWHYGSKFVFELWKRFDHPVLLEMSTMQHHLWAVRSRMGAWDHPTRSHKRFIDIHAQANAALEGMFLPMHLGWWAVKTWSGPQGEQTFPDDIEYLCCKALGNDVGISLQSVNPNNYAASATLQRLGGIIRTYETLRHAKAFPESIKARLRVPGDEFTLAQEPGGETRLHPARYAKQVIEPYGNTSAVWVVTNAFERQPLRLRLETWMSAEAYDATNAITIADFVNPAEFVAATPANGVTATLIPSTEQIKAGTSSGLLTATNAGSVRTATWASFVKTFAPTLNLGGDRALGVWVYGDGQGEVLNLQLSCPSQVVAGLGEHYIVVDFIGWRYFELIEPEGERFAAYTWPYNNLYDIYRERVDYTQIEKLTVWVNNLPANGTVRCLLSPVRATPLVTAKIRNPRVTLGGCTLTFPTDIESGSYLEFHSTNACSVFGTDGKLLRAVQVVGAVPELAPGENNLRFERDPEPVVFPRVRVTTITTGAALEQ